MGKGEMERITAFYFILNFYYLVLKKEKRMASVK